MEQLLKTNGICQTCNKSIAKRSALKHIDSCFLANNNVNDAPNHAFVMRVLDEGGLFWIYLSVPFDSTLKQLDEYIRKLWLECCGHLSKFKIAGNNYHAYPDADYGDASMTVAVKRLLDVGSKAEYQYDFGSTTHLLFEVVREYNSKVKGKITLLLRNEMPQVACHVCQKEKPGFICSFCQQVSCKKCMKKDECNTTDGFLLFVNSPRTGTCGYMG